MVGPVTLALIEEGLAAGKIPDQAEVSHVDRKSWMPVHQLFLDGPHAHSGIRKVPEPPAIPPAPPVPRLVTLESAMAPAHLIEAFEAQCDNEAAASQSPATPRIEEAPPADPARQTLKMDHPEIEDPESFVDTVPSARSVVRELAPRAPAEPQAQGLREAPTIPATPMARASVPEWPVHRKDLQRLGQQLPPQQGVPQAPASFPDNEPVDIPKQGFWESLFG
jgi:hypothetical protein